MEEDQNQLRIELSDDIAQGTYANLTIIAHSSSEFIIDFIALMPSTPKAKVKSRIIMAPEHAKRLLMALQENVHKYENEFGHIEINNSSEKYPLTVGEA